MSEPRLKAAIWIKALMRRAWALDVPAFQLRKGSEEQGAILIRMNGGGAAGTVVYGRGMMVNGDWGWRRGTGPDPVPEADADAYVDRQLRFDPDLWVIEIESSDLEQFVDEPVE